MGFPTETKNNLAVLISEMKKAMLGGGELALSAQGNVKNIGKKIETLEKDTLETAQRRAAQTVIDGQVQELILQTVVRMGESHDFFLDAEEETPSVKLFTNRKSRTSLVIDPIDGTFEYLQGRDGYSICVGLLEDGAILTAIVYFPARRCLYAIEADGRSLVTIYDDALRIKEIKELRGSRALQQNVIYRNKRVADDVAECLARHGYTVHDDAGAESIWSEAILKCLGGGYAACIFHTPQIRDVLLGAILANMPNGYATDWNGKPLVWPKSGRVPRVMFGIGAPPEKILACLKPS